LPRLFISHSSADNVAAVAFKQWLGANRWPPEDVFLDLHDIGAGERWKDALVKARSRCEAVVLLASPDALASPECLVEVRMAETFGKEIIVVLLRDLALGDRRLDAYKERQIVDLAAQPCTHVEVVDYEEVRHEVYLNRPALDKIKDYLVKRGITPDSFPWPPEGKPNAEPFPGLSAFTDEDAAIFFGRDADILNGLDELRLLRRNGTPRLLAIQAASGAGKSSYLRAGLWPRLRHNLDFAPLAILRPAQGILTGREGLGHRLAAVLSRPDDPVHPGDIHRALMAQDQARASEEFIKLMKRAAAQALEGRRISDPNALAPALIIAVDQAEELFAPDDAEESQRFLHLLAALMREPTNEVDAFVLFTVRSDSLAQLCELLAGQELETPKTLMLLALPRTSYRDVIVKPTELLARRGQILTISAPLVERLVGDATGADALPLLAFTLSYLYQEFGAAGTITLEHYDSIGGVSGAIDKALRQALARPQDAPAIPRDPEEQLACLRATFIPWLARIDQRGEALRRVAKVDEFAGASRAMVERLIEKRLLVRELRAGSDVVEIAHESLLRQWPPLTGWLRSAADDLRVVDSVELTADEWARNKRAPAWLDHRADRLAAAERVARNEDFRRRLGKNGLEYLDACRARENRRRRIVWAIACGVAAVIVIALGLGIRAWQQTQEAARARTASAAALLIGQSQTNRMVYGNVPRAIEQAAQAYKLIPDAPSRSALLSALMEISPHLKGVIPFAEKDLAQALVWTSDDRFDVATGSRLLTFNAANPAAPPAAWNLPSVKRPTDGNPALVHTLAQLGSGRTIAVFNEGSIGVYRGGSTAMTRQAPQQALSVGPTQHTVSVGGSGALIALASADGPILLYRCNWNAAGQSTAACSVASLGNVQGRVVAISPDETRVAVGDGSTVTVYNLSGVAIGGGPRTFAGSVLALGWAEQRDWVAVGTDNGELVVFDPAADPARFVAQQAFGDHPVNALAWNPKQLGLAFVCNETAVCLLRANAGADAAEPFKPAMRLAGHVGAVTRLGFAPNGTQLASIAVDNTVRVWDLAQDANVTIALYADRGAPLSTVAVSPDRQWVAAGSDDGAVQLWDAKSATAGPRFQFPEGFEVRDLAWNHKGAVAALNFNTANQTNTVAIAANEARQPTINLPAGTTKSRYLTWTQDDLMIAVPTGEGGVVLLNPGAPGDAPVRIEGDRTGESWGLAAIPGTHQLAVSYIGGGIKIFDLETKKIVGTMQKPGEKKGLGSLSISPDGRLLATSSGDSFVPVYDIGKRAILNLLKTESPQISTAAFSPDGRKLAALGSDGWLYIWSLRQSEPELYLALPVMTRRAIVGNDASGRQIASWLAWVADDQIAIAVGTAAISVVNIDPDKWLKRVDALALTPNAGIQ
jgi:WD40 repeat protein